MTAFHERSWNQRLEEMGDMSERACYLVHHGRVHSCGLNRVWDNGVGLYMNDMTLQMRYMPDKMTRTAFVECMGIGRDSTLKIKEEKLVALLSWNALSPTDLFVYDSVTDEYWQASIEHWNAALQVNPEMKQFPEGKNYYALHRDNFPTEPTPVPELPKQEIRG